MSYPHTHKLKYFILLAALTASASSCTPHIAPAIAEHSVPVPAEFPLEYYRQAKKFGSSVLSIDQKKSLIVIDVRRGGLLSHLGHDHVVASHDVTGFVDITGNRADLYVPFERLVVDELVLRTEANLNTQPTQEAITGTRQNMLTKVLEADRFPFALIHISRNSTDHTKLSIRITMHDTAKSYEVSAKVESQQNELIVSGIMTINQTDFGITPFSILGGAMHVQDKLDLRFRIVASSA